MVFRIPTLATELLISEHLLRGPAMKLKDAFLNLFAWNKRHQEQPQVQEPANPEAPPSEQPVVMAASFGATRPRRVPGRRSPAGSL